MYGIFEISLIEIFLAKIAISMSLFSRFVFLNFEVCSFPVGFLGMLNECWLQLVYKWGVRIYLIHVALRNFNPNEVTLFRHARN